MIEVLLLVAVTSSLKRVFFWSFTRHVRHEDKNSPQGQTVRDAVVTSQLTYKVQQSPWLGLLRLPVTVDDVSHF